MAQQKKTEPLEAEDLPDLSAEDQIFVQCLSNGDNATDAWRASRPDSKAEERTVWMMASRLRNSDKVQMWLTAARNALLHTGTCTLEGHMRELERLRGVAEASGNLGAAVQAEQLRGKAQGLYIDQIKDLTQLPADQLIEQINDTLGPEIAKILASQLGLEHETKH